MTAVTYAAKRSLISGHTLGTDYSLDLALTRETPGLAREVKTIVAESLSGVRETLRQHAIKYYDVSLASIQGGSALNAVLEFLDSVESGETFTFDFYGSVATPHDPQDATLDRGGYQLTRQTAVGAGGATDYFTASFRVRVVVP